MNSQDLEISSQDQFACLSCHFDAELLLCTMLDFSVGRGALDVPGIVSAVLKSFDTERGRLLLLRSALFCRHALLFDAAMHEIIHGKLSSSTLRHDACKLITARGFDDRRRSAAAAAAAALPEASAINYACLKVLATGCCPLLTSFKLMCGFVINTPFVWSARFFDASGHTGRLTLAFAVHRCFGYLPALPQLRRDRVVEEHADCDDAEWSRVFRDIGLHENASLLESLFVKYLKVADRERCAETQESIIVAAATLWQRIGRIRITRRISHYAFNAETGRLKYVTGPRYRYGPGEGPVVSSCPLEALEAALLVYNLTRNAVEPALAASTLTCARNIQCLVAAGLPDNIFAHYTGLTVTETFGVQLVRYLLKGQQQTVLTHLFLKTALLSDPATVIALKAEYCSMAEGVSKLLLLRYLQPVLQTAESIACSEAKKQRLSTE